MSNAPLSKKAHQLPQSLTSPPTIRLVPPGQCQFTPEFASSQLLEKWTVSSTSTVFRFSLPDKDKPLNLSTCACILAKATVGDEKEAVIRPYTPISTNDLVGSFDLLVKDYGPTGKMSHHLHQMSIGSSIEFKHIDFNVKIQAPFTQKQIGMIVGGTGITPMIQALHAILGDPDSPTQNVSMLYGSRVKDDILGEEMLKEWEGGKLKVTHVLSNEPEDSDWKGERGFINEKLVKELLPSPEGGEDVIIFVCGPPPMYKALCGPREEKELSGVLNDCGYKASQVYKF